MKNKQKLFLQQLGYTIEDITYTLCEGGDRYSDYSYTKHEVSLAYKTETKELKNFKEAKEVYQLAKYTIGVEQFILEDVYRREFDNVLSDMALEYVTNRRY